MQNSKLFNLTLIAGLFAGGMTSAEPLKSPGPQSLNFEESMSSEQRARKIELCGANSLVRDSISHFSANQFGWYPGQAKVLFDPHQAFLTRVLLIQKAKISIDISTYTFTADEATYALLDELRRAVRRGVNVRFLADAGGSAVETVTDQYRHLRTLILDAKIAMQDFSSNKLKIKPGKVDIVIFHPLFRLRTIESHLQDHFVNHLAAGEETSINLDRRSHDKIFMIDKEDPTNTYAIVGGRNFDGNYFSLPLASQDLFEDIDVLLHNDIRAQNSYNLVNTLGAHYQELFCSKGNRWLKLESLDGELDKLKLQGLEDVATKLAAKDLMGALSRLNLKAGMTQILEEMKGSSGFDFVVNGLVDAKLWAGNEVENLKHSVSSILVDPNEEFKETLHNGNSIYNQIRSLITDAETSIDVCTPYVFVAKNERECLKRWVMQKPGRHIRLLSNSAATSDSALTITSFDRETAPGLMLGNTYECHYPKIVNGQPVIENGKPVEIVDKGEFDNHDLKIRVYELGRMDNKLFAGETIDGKPALASYFYGKLHAKFGIIDGKFSFVGSDNLDPRSRHLNSETTMFVESEYIAGDFTQAFETLVSRSYLYGSPELEQMQKLKAVQKRIKSMNRLDKLFKKIPISGFAN